MQQETSHCAVQDINARLVFLTTEAIAFSLGSYEANVIECGLSNRDKFPMSPSIKVATKQKLIASGLKAGDCGYARAILAQTKKASASINAPVPKSNCEVGPLLTGEPS